MPSKKRGFQTSKVSLEFHIVWPKGAGESAFWRGEKIVELSSAIDRFLDSKGILRRGGMVVRLEDGWAFPGAK